MLPISWPMSVLFHQSRTNGVGTLEPALWSPRIADPRVNTFLLILEIEYQLLLSARLTWLEVVNPVGLLTVIVVEPSLARTARLVLMNWLDWSCAPSSTPALVASRTSPMLPPGWACTQAHSIRTTSSASICTWL